MKTLQTIQTVGFLTALIAGTGDTWTNLTILVVGVVIFGVSTYKLRNYES